MALSSCERFFLRKYLATDDHAAQLAAWRECGCVDGTDAVVKQRMAALVQRADAAGFLDALRRRLAILERAAEREQAEQRADEQSILREIRMTTLELSDEVLRKEAERLAAGERKSVQGFARLAAQIDAMTGEAPAGGGLNRKEAEERYAKARKQAETARVVFVPPQMPGEVPNA